MKIFYRLTSFLFFFFSIVFSINGQVIYVNQAAAGAGDGSSWANAFNDLQDAIDAAVDQEIWIAAGTYLPSSPELDTFNTFLVVKDVSFYGGFAGDETSKDERVPGENTTILSIQKKCCRVFSPPTSANATAISLLPPPTISNPNNNYKM